VALVDYPADSVWELAGMVATTACLLLPGGEEATEGTAGV